MNEVDQQEQTSNELPVPLLKVARFRGGLDVLYKDISIPQRIGPFTVREAFTERLPTKLPLILVWSLYKGTQQSDSQNVALIATFGALASGGITVEDRDKMIAFAEDLEDQLTIIRLMGIPEIFPKVPRNQEILQSFTYALLKQKEINYTEAAAFVSEIRGKRTTPGAWRMHLTRWAKKRGLPAIELERGRPPKEK